MRLRLVGAKRRSVQFRVILHGICTLNEQRSGMKRQLATGYPWVPFSDRLPPGELYQFLLPLISDLSLFSSRFCIVQRETGLFFRMMPILGSAFLTKECIRPLAHSLGSSCLQKHVTGRLHPPFLSQIWLPFRSQRLVKTFTGVHSYPFQVGSFGHAYRHSAFDSRTVMASYSCS
jgi:hypothetical protein